ncbi:hypothetical protein BDZ89DRAFT_466470 [Hymenopellis radicata]|nr:hypothetical protein BDZ89DRAFT_466470 [Hymenopellis radicata]
MMNFKISTAHGRSRAPFRGEAGKPLHVSPLVTVFQLFLPRSLSGRGGGAVHSIGGGRLLISSEMVLIVSENKGTVMHFGRQMIIKGCYSME